jgi:hypothetical protein
MLRKLRPERHVQKLLSCHKLGLSERQAGMQAGTGAMLVESTTPSVGGWGVGGFEILKMWYQLSTMVL